MPLSRRHYARLTRTALLLCALTATQQFATAQDTEQHTPELPNFHRVGEQLYRGAQPKAGGIARLAALGFNTVINLRGDDERAHTEGEAVELAGMRYFHVPFKRLGAPTDEQIARVLALINEAANGKVFVHCQRGADRTGTVIAIYHITHDNWTNKQAQHEADKRGMRFWQRGMKNYISDYGIANDLPSKTGRKLEQAPSSVIATRTFRLRIENSILHSK